MTKLSCTIKVSEENFKRLWSLAGELQKERGSNKSPDDAINCLFDYKDQLESIKKKEKGE